MRVVAISPHSDDVELGLGGYVNWLRREAGLANVEAFVLAKGNASASKTTEYIRGADRKSEGLASADLLGMSVEFLDAAQDGAFNTTPRGMLVKAVEDAIYREPADEVFIPLPSFHDDHTAAYEACISALRPRTGRTLPARVYAYEYPGQAWGPAPPATGRVYKKLSTLDIDAKVKALTLHQSQWVSSKEGLIGEYAIRALADLRGAEVGVRVAEMYYALRQII